MSVSVEACVVDMAHLDRYTGGEAQLNAEVLNLFSGQAGSLLDRLEEAIAAADKKAWHDNAHSLKGGARGIGAFALADAAAAAEPLDPAASPALAGQALRTLRLRAQAVQRFVADYLSR
jgi:HPt (histidine-containing phosphotransfer) domain-containing protein